MNQSNNQHPQPNQLQQNPMRPAATDNETYQSQPIAPKSSAPIHPNQHKKPIYKKVWFWIIVVLVLGIIGASFNSHEQDKPSSGSKNLTAQPPKASAAPTTSAAPAEKTAKIGSVVTSGPFELTVTKVQTGIKELGQNPIITKAQGQFVIVSMTVKNIAKQANYFSGDSIKLLGADKTEYSVTTEASIYLGKEATLFNQINPGNTMTGKVAFDIPAGVNPTTLKFSGGPLDKSIEITIS